MAKIHYASNGKRDLHGLEGEYIKAKASLRSEKWKFPGNKELVISYLNLCETGRAKSGGSNKRIEESTLYRVMGILRLLSEQWLQKDFKKATAEDWTNFYERMESGEIKNERGMGYKQGTKAKNYKAIRKFLKTVFGGGKDYVNCSDWCVTEEPPTKEYLTRAEVERIVNSAFGIRVKTLIMMLFDGGFRIEELSNLRWRDLRKPEGKKYYRASIRAETSKTRKSREVSLWLATDMIDNYWNSEKERLGKDFSDDKLLFPTSYHHLYMTVRRLGKKILGKDISPHTLRHSSATHYAGIIKTYQQFCARYGWALKSGIAQRYFHAITDDEIASQAEDHEIARFKTAFEQVSTANKILTERVERQEKQMTRAIKLLRFIMTESKKPVTLEKDEWNQLFDAIENRFS